MDPKITAIVDQKKPLRTLVYDAIKAAIIYGELKPGERLRHESLAKQFNVSHTPVRQALERLVADGFADRVAYRGIRVVSLNEEEIAEVYTFRLLLEPIAIRLAAENISENTIEELSALIGKANLMVSLEQMNERREINRDFHEKIIKECGKLVLTRLIKLIWNRYQSYWIFYEGMFRQPEFVEKQYQQENAEHLAIINALAAHDSERAERLAYDHIQAFLTDYLIGLLGFPAELIGKVKGQMWPTI